MYLEYLQITKWCRIGKIHRNSTIPSYHDHALRDEDVGEGVLVVLGDAEDVFAVPLKVVGDVDAAAQVQARHVLLLAAGALKSRVGLQIRGYID